MLKRYLTLITFAIFCNSAGAQSRVYSLLKDIGSGYSSYPSGLTAFNGSVYFFASNTPGNANQLALWKTDGTTDGTQLLKDSIGSGFVGGLPELVVFNGQLYFLSVMYGIDFFTAMLWTSDGTTAGTQIVKTSTRSSSIGGSDGPSASCSLIPFNNKLYFNFYDADGGMEPWFTDGTTAGTDILVNIATDQISGALPSSSPQSFTVFENALYFWATPRTNNGPKAQLWKSDGTTAGSESLGEFYEDASTSRKSSLVGYNGKLYFSARTSDVSGYELYAADGTVFGFQQVKNLNPGSLNQGDGVSPYFNAKIFNNRLYFWGFDPASGHELWSTDGTTAGTSLLANTNASNLASINPAFYNSDPFFIYGGKMYYANNDGINGKEPWVTDGTTAGTQLLANLAPTSQGSIGLWNPGYYIFNGRLHLRGSISGSPEIISVDTSTNTISRYFFESGEQGFIYADVPYDFSSSSYDRFSMVELNGKLIFPAGYSEVPAAITEFDFELMMLEPSVTTSIKNVQQSAQVFPIPSSNWLFAENLQGGITPSVYDISGRIIAVSAIPNGDAGNWKFDVSSLAPGLYYLQAGKSLVRFIKN